MRKKSIAFKYFLEQNTNSSSASTGTTNKIKKYECKFCKTSYALHATRMLDHLIKCTCCPEIIKNELKKEQKKGKRIQEETSSVPTNVSALSTSPQTVRTTSASTSISSLSSFIDRTTRDESEKLNKLLATAVYASGTPLNITSNQYWINFFKHIRPSFELPSRYKLSNTLLDEVYHDVKLNIEAKLFSAYSVGVQCDGWTNIKNESIINFIVTTPEPLFYKTLTSNEIRHTGEYIAEQIDMVFNEIGINRILGFCSDNASNMKKAWQLLGEKYKDKPIKFYSCSAHTLNLIITDIIKLKTVDNLLNSAKAIVKAIKGKSVALAIFKRIQNEKQNKIQTCSLKLPISTRWASIVICFESLQKNKAVLKELAILDECDEIIGKSNRKNILDDDHFWKKINSILILLNPIKKWITLLESDKYRISEVAVAFYEIENVFNSELAQSVLLKEEESKVNSSLQERRKMCLKQTHFAANMLDPRFKGQHLKSEEVLEGLEYIYEVATHFNNVDENIVLANIADYRAESGFWASGFVKNSVENIHITPVNFWKGICTDMPLRYIAESILTLPATSAATERSFSSYGNILNKKRNRLNTKRAARLVYVQHNLRLIKNYAESEFINESPTNIRYEDQNNPGPSTSQIVHRQEQEYNSESTNDDTSSNEDDSEIDDEMMKQFQDSDDDINDFSSNHSGDFEQNLE